MVVILHPVLLFALAGADPLSSYQACVRNAAAKAGSRASITDDQADRIAATCKALLPSAAAQLVDNGYITNAPAHLQTRSNLLQAAAFDIEHRAKMSISAHVPALPPR